jgi:hypothetical protein
MLLFLAADAVNETSTSYHVGTWVGRAVLLLLVVALVAKLVFKKDITIGRKKQ